MQSHAYYDGNIPPMERPCVRPFLRFRPWGSQALAEAPPPYSVNMWPRPSESASFRSAA